MHGYVGAGFLAATFLVRPFLPSEEEADKDILCNRFVIMVLDIYRGPRCSVLIFLLHLSFSLSRGLLFKQIFTIVIQPTNRLTNRPSYRRATGLIGGSYTYSIKCSCPSFSFRLTSII